MKKLAKRILISPIVLLFVTISIILWISDLAIWLLKGNYTSDLREGFEGSEIAGKVIDPIFLWSEK